MADELVGTGTGVLASLKVLSCFRRPAPLWAIGPKTDLRCTGERTAPLMTAGSRSQNIAERVVAYCDGRVLPGLSLRQRRELAGELSWQLWRGVRAGP